MMYAYELSVNEDFTARDGAGAMGTKGRKISRFTTEWKNVIL